MIKIALNNDSIYIVDVDSSKVIDLYIGNNWDYYFNFDEYDNSGKFEYIIKQNKDCAVYNIFNSFYDALLEYYLLGENNKINNIIYKEYYKVGKVPAFYDEHTKTIAMVSDDSDVGKGEQPNLFQIKKEENQITLVYEKQNSYCNGIRIRTARSVYQSFMVCFYNLRNELLKCKEALQIDEGYKAYQMTNIYKELNK